MTQRIDMRLVAVEMLKHHDYIGEMVRVFFAEEGKTQPNGLMTMLHFKIGMTVEEHIAALRESADECERVKRELEKW